MLQLCALTTLVAPFWNTELLSTELHVVMTTVPKILTTCSNGTQKADTLQCVEKDAEVLILLGVAVPDGT